jgi:transcriptional regulator with XRE-family HTH domain
MTLSKEALGRYLAQLRRDAGLAQRECAQALGVSDRAVSKWETGSAFPGMETLVRLADLYRVPLADLFAQAEGARRPLRVAAAGLDRDAAARALPALARALLLKGFDVAAVAPRDDDPWPGDCGPDTAQAAVACSLELAREAAAATGLDPERGIVLCSAGAAEAAVGRPRLEAERLFADAGTDPAGAAGRYDLVVLFECAGDDKAAARAAAWRAAGRLVPVDADAPGAVDAACRALLSALGAGAPFAAPRTLLVRRASRLALDALPGVRMSAVETTFARTPAGGASQLDAVTGAGRAVYLADGAPISSDRFRWMSAWADPAFARVRADRWSLYGDDVCLQIDRFAFMPYTDLVRVHVPEGAPVRLPHGIELVRDVTESPRFSMPTLARDRALGRL